METNKTKKRKIIDSTDSESEDSETNSLKRKSVRISQKRNKPEFQLPSRDEIWKNIPSMKEESSLKRLTPKKSVNNFTKIYNDYNFDDYEDTSESISSDESLEEEETSSRKQEKKHRISNYYSRIVKASSSDEEQKIEPSDPQMTCTSSKDPETNDSSPDKGSMPDEHKKCDDSESDVSTSPGRRPKRKRAKKKLYAFPLSEDEENDS